MPKKVAILGNGPSYTLLQKQAKDYDVVVGCNVPPLDLQYEFTVIADEKAIITAVRDHKVQERMPIVIGPCAEKANDICKYKPGGKLGIIAGLNRAKKLYDKVEEPFGYTDSFRRSGYFSSGHLAYKYVVENFDCESITMYGFDSLFTGKQTTYTDYIMGGTDSVEKALNPTNKRHVSPPIWYDTWNWILHEHPISDVPVRFMTFDGQLPERWDLFKKHVAFTPVLL